MVFQAHDGFFGSSHAKISITHYLINPSISTKFHCDTHPACELVTACLTCSSVFCNKCDLQSTCQGEKTTPTTSEFLIPTDVVLARLSFLAVCMVFTTVEPDLIASLNRDQLFIAIIRLHSRNYARYTIYGSCLPILWIVIVKSPSF